MTSQNQVYVSIYGLARYIHTYLILLGTLGLILRHAIQILIEYHIGCVLGTSMSIAQHCFWHLSPHLLALDKTSMQMVDYLVEFRQGDSRCP